MRQSVSKTAVIISGGSIDTAFVLKRLNEHKGAVLIGVDRGTEFLYKNSIMPDHIVGDFDSADPGMIEYYKAHTNVKIREFNPVKDATDTEIAVRLALSLACEEILLLGATGTRLDHVLGNIQTLSVADRAGVSIRMEDPYNRISLIGGKAAEKRLRRQDCYGKYFSVFPLGEEVKGFSISGAKYPLVNHTLCPYNSLCVSNEIKEDEVVISFPEGTVILMETKDDK